MSVRMVLPKGRQQNEVIRLLGDAGISIRGAERSYRPIASDPRLSLKLLKSQNIPTLVALGQHDCGFTGRDWIDELGAPVIEVMDLGLDPVRIVASVPEESNLDDLRRRRIIAVSEYRNLTCNWLEREAIAYDFVQAWGATEVFPPEDGDLVVDNSSTGSTLVANRLKVVATLMESSTRFIANEKALDDPERRRWIEDLAVLVRGVLEGRRRVLLEMNCTEEGLKEVVALLPSMKAPTVSRLYCGRGLSVKAAVPRDSVRELIPQLLAAGASDILETAIRKVTP